MTSHERNPHTIETGLSSQIDIELSPEDESDLFHLLLEYADLLPITTDPTKHEMTADGMKLNHHADASSLLHGKVWNRYDTLDMTYANIQEQGPSAELHFKTPQKYDASSLTYNHYQGAWMLTSQNRSQIPQIVTNDEVLSLLAMKLQYNTYIYDVILHKNELSSNEIPNAIMLALAPLAESRTEQRTYQAKTIIENDAYASPLVAKFSKDEGAIAMDYRIRLEVQGIPIVPGGFTPDSPVSYITHAYEHTVTIPYESGYPEFTESTFGITTNDESISKKYILALTEAERELDRTGDALRQAFKMIESKHLC